MEVVRKLVAPIVNCLFSGAFLAPENAEKHERAFNQPALRTASTGTEPICGVNDLKMQLCVFQFREDFQHGNGAIEIILPIIFMYAFIYKSFH